MPSRERQGFLHAGGSWNPLPLFRCPAGLCWCPGRWGWRRGWRREPSGEWKGGMQKGLMSRFIMVQRHFRAFFRPSTQLVCTTDTAGHLPSLSWNKMWKGPVSGCAELRRSIQAVLKRERERDARFKKVYSSLFFSLSFLDLRGHGHPAKCWHALV